MKKIALILISFAFLISPTSDLLAQTGKDKPEFTMRLQSAWEAAFGLNDLAKYVVKQIEYQSKGRIKVEFYTAGQIVPGMEVWDATSSGIIDAAHVCSCYTVGKNIALGFYCNGTTMPPPALKNLWLYKHGGLDVAQKLFDQFYKVKVFPAAVITEAWAYSNKEIKNINDLRGLKFRASGIRAGVLKNLGVSALSLPAGEVMPSMEKGVIDAFELSALAYDKDLKVDEVAKYIYYSHYVDGGNLNLIVNNDWWNKLPADLQKVIKDACYDSNMWSVGYGATLEIESMEISERLNKTEIRWLPQDVEEALVASGQALIEKEIKNGNKSMQAIKESLDAFMVKYDKFGQFRGNMF